MKSYHTPTQESYDETLIFNEYKFHMQKALYDFLTNKISVADFDDILRALNHSYYDKLTLGGESERMLRNLEFFCYDFMFKTFEEGKG